MSITTVPVRKFEPGVPPLRRRIETLRRLGSEGIETWVSLAPVIPGAVFVDLDELFDEMAAARVSSVSFSILRFTGYDLSKSMFEASTGMSAQDALLGSEDTIAKLTDLVRRHGMEPKGHDAGLGAGPQGPPSLDGFL